MPKSKKSPKSSKEPTPETEVKKEESVEQPVVAEGKEEKTEMPTPEPTEENSEEQPKPSTDEPAPQEVPAKKGKFKLFVILIILATLVLLIGTVLALWFLLFRNKDSDNGKKADDNGDTETTCTYDADLVEDIAIEGASDISVGDVFTKKWSVKNTGTCDWGEEVEMAFVSGDTIGNDASIDIQETGSGETSEVSLTLAAPETAGSYQSVWKLSKEGENNFGDPLTLGLVVKEAAPAEPEKADLIVTSVTTNPAEVRQGVPIKVIAKVKNQGGTNAVGFTVTWRAATSAGSPIVTFPGTTTLTPGQETTLQLDYTYGGWNTYTTQVKVDTENKVAESNEGNNTRDLVVQVNQGLSDVIVESITYNPTTPVSGEFTLVTIVYKNIGYQDIAQDLTLRWWQSDSAPNPNCEQVVEGVDAGESKSTICFYSFPSWYPSIKTRATIDTANVAAEGNETNNTTTKTISVSAP